MMLQGPVMEGERKRMALPLWPGAAIPPLAVFVLVGGWLAQRGAEPFPATLPAGFGSPHQVATLLLGRYLLAFELISIVLLVAIIGALSLGHRERTQP
jgi:NADH:ubiquinone oxidoreductase subunit 6 (subunit J)